MPFPLPWRTFAHSCLERPQLRNRLETLECPDGFPQKFSIWVIPLRFAQDGFQ